VDRERLLNRVHSLGAHVGEIRVLRKSLEQFGTRIGVDSLGERQGPPVMVLGLARGPGGRRRSPAAGA
jgi:hypothetical protein